MLPSRPTLQGWNPESLATSATSITDAATSVVDAVRGIDDACQRMPETRAWSGRSHDAATAMFGRAEKDASKVSEYATGVASALKTGSETIGPARTSLLDRADAVDAGPPNVTDQWVVLIDPVRMSAEEFAKLEKLAAGEQTVINGLLTKVGGADDDTADAVVSAGSKYGYAEPRPTGGDPFQIPVATRPGDEVPNPRDPIGMMAQEAIRNGDQMVAIREVIEGENSAGEETTTLIMQDGSKQVITRRDPFEWASKQNFYTVEHFDPDGNMVSETSSWHDMGNDCDYTSINWPDGSNFTMSMDPTGYRTAGFTTATGRHSAVPSEVIDNMSLVAGAGLSGLDAHVVNGGTLPMLTEESLEKLGKSAKFGGPALVLGTTVFDMVMAESGRDACVAAFAGAAGGGGAYGLAELGAAAGAATGPAAPLMVPVLAAGGALLGGWKGADLGKAIGGVLCPY